jgi:hypothetical protein
MAITAAKEIDDNTRVLVKVSIENDDHDESSARQIAFCTFVRH